ncbi:unnamed protein product, partial [Staurois parvus]
MRDPGATLQLASLAVFPSVARGKVSAPQAVTLSYTQAYHAALLRNHLPCPALPRCPSCSVPSNIIRRMPASVFRVPFPAASGRTGDGTAGNLKMTRS